MGSPLITRAESTAEAPGIGTILTSSSMALLISE